MAEVIKETTVTEQSDTNQVSTTPVEKDASSFQTVQYLIYFFFGAVDILLLFRLVLKLLGANPSSSFVDLTYSLSRIFILPFEGIFSTGRTEGLETTSILEPATIIAIIVYGILAWGIVKLVQVLSGKQQTS